jgi:hypothetical protein
MKNLFASTLKKLLASALIGVLLSSPAWPQAKAQFSYTPGNPGQLSLQLGNVALPLFNCSPLVATSCTPTNVSNTVRTRLAANTTFFVNPSTGSDSNNCLTTGTACATFQHAYSVVANNYDLGGFTATISNSTGAAYSGQLNLTGGYLGGAQVPIIIDNGGGAWSSSGSCITTIGSYGFYQVQNVNFSGSGCDGYDILNQVPAFIELGAGVTLGNATTAMLGSVSDGSTIQIGTTLNIAGSSPIAFFAAQGGTIIGTDSTSVVAITGSPSISVFANANGLGTIQVLNFTFSGSVTGQRYSSTVNSVIQTDGGGANYFPGTSAGTTATGGIYQ